MNIAVVGATGEVGRMMTKVLIEQNVPVTNIEFFASKKSQGKVLKFKNKDVVVQELTEEAMQKKFDFILMSAGGFTSKKFSSIAQAAGNIIIDNSSAFRRDENIPLVVPEINGNILKNYRGIIANPNCSTIQMVLPLYALSKEFNLKKVVVSTYQSVSGSGNTGITTMMEQRKGSLEKNKYPRLIDMNVIPQIGDFLESGYSEEEEKMIFEPRKIMNMPNLQVSATTVRVPVIYGHSEAIYAEFEKEVDLNKAASALKNFPSIVYHDKDYITPIEIKNSDDSHVCRLRLGTDNKSLAFWNVAHNIRVGAATNAVRILIKMMELQK